MGKSNENVDVRDAVKGYCQKSYVSLLTRFDVITSCHMSQNKHLWLGAKNGQKKRTGDFWLVNETSRKTTAL